MSRYFILAFVCLFVISSISLADGDTWVKKANISRIMVWHSACAVNGKIYVFGGIFGNKIVEEYDPATNKWTRKTDMPMGRDSFSVEAVNGKIYVIGGENEGGVDLSAVEEYDPIADTWTEKAKTLTKHRDFASGSANGKIYAFGGWVTSAVEEYDPLADKWSMKNNMLALNGFSRASAVNGKIYITGGGMLSTLVAEYDPMTDTWSRKADMPTARMNHSTCVSNGKVYAIGGCGGWVGADWGDGMTAVEEYDPIKDEWVKRADMPTARLAFAAVAVNGKIYAIGGASKGAVGDPALTIEEYTPEGWPFVVYSKGKLTVTWGEIKRTKQD